MNYSNLYKRLRLDELGIPSEEEAEELEYELDLRFRDFTPTDRRTWLRQSDYLEHFSRIGTLSSAAEKAGVTVYTAQGWQYDNALGFTRRDEVATLIFKDSLKEKALLRASDPKAPVTLLIALLRAYIPEEFSRGGHKYESSKSDELLRRYSEGARREQEAGHSKLRKLAEGAENAYPDDNYHTDMNDYPAGPVILDDNYHTDMNDYPDDNYHTDMNDYPAEPVSPDDNELAYSNLSPAGEPSGSHLSPAGGETQRGGLSRAQRRAQLRQQRKAEKKNTFPVKRF